MVEAAALFDTVDELTSCYANALAHLTKIQGVFGHLWGEKNFNIAKSIKTTFYLTTLEVKLVS